MLDRVSANKESVTTKPKQGLRTGFSPEPSSPEPLSDEAYGPPNFSYSLAEVASAGRPENAGAQSRRPSLPELPIQEKLTIGAVDDPAEREADRVSEEVMRTRSDVGAAIGTAHAANGSSQGGAPHGVYDALCSPGKPLDAATRAFFEPRFGHDFSQVSVHAEPLAQRSADHLDARAYTVGQHIVLGSTARTVGAEYSGLIAHELAHVVQQGQGTAAGVVRRSPGPPKPSPPSPPEWLGGLRAGATHLQGDIWEIQIPGLGRSPVGPYEQLRAYLRGFNQNRPPNVERLEAAHIIGGEHMGDLGWEMPYEKAPCVGVAESLHSKWTTEISNLQSKAGPMGGRATKTLGRAAVRPEDVKALYREVYRGFPELGEISDRIVDLEAKRIMSAKYGMPAPKSPMEVHEGGMPKREPPMDAHKGGMPKAEPPMDLHEGGMPKAEVSAPAAKAGLGGGIKAGIKTGLKEALSAENIAAEIPETILGIADRIAAREAIKAIKTKFVKEGFAKGVAAGVMGWSGGEVASNLKNRVTPFRVKGMEDPGGLLGLTFILRSAEAHENHAVDVGYQFSVSKPLKWKEEMRARGFSVLKEYGYRFGENPQVLFEYEFIDKLAWVLRPTTDQIVENA